MFRVQFRDAANRNLVIAKTMYLPFDPRDQKEVRIRQRGKDEKHIGYRVVDHHYEIVIDDPGESGVVVYLAKM